MKEENEIKIIKRIPLNDGTHTWEYIDNIDQYDFNKDRPIVLIFGGNATNGPKPTKGNANTVDSLLGVFRNDVDLYSVDYNGSQCFGEDIMPLVESIFLPLMSDNGKRLPIDLALQRMRRITIFSHCYGALYPLEEILWKLTFSISNLGYSEDEECEILKQIVAVSFATKRPTPFVSGLDILSLTDDTFEKERIELAKKFLKDQGKVKLNPNDKPFIKEQLAYFTLPLKLIDFIEQNDRCYILPHENGRRLGLIASNFSTGGDHSIKPISLSSDWESLEGATPTGYAVSKCVGAVLCNSVANSMMNLSSNKHIPFDIHFLQQQLEEIVQKTNETEANYSI